MSTLPAKAHRLEAPPAKVRRTKEPPVKAHGAKPRPVTVLPIVRELVERLDRAGIRYCHFKSNQHLDEGVSGITDLDVLVDRSAGTELARILAEAGYKRFSPPPAGGYPAVEDYLGFDHGTGALVHLHLHHRLTAGERHLKGYRLPWEELVLATRTRDEVTGFPVSDPSMEFLLLMVRSALKARLLDQVLSWFGRPYPGDAEMREYTWLLARLDVNRVRALGAATLGEDAGRILAALADAPPTLARLRELRRSGRRTLDLHRTFAPADAFLRRSLRTFLAFGMALARGLANPPCLTSRANPRGGVLVALLGADGSGKSTLTQRMCAWLRWKVDARVVYFGSGDGPVSLARRPLLMLLRLLGATRRAGPAWWMRGGLLLLGRRRADAPVDLARAVWALLIASEKRATLRRAWQARNRGITVLCDRYPQNQVMGFNDGPLLGSWADSPSGWRRALARWEAEPYRWAEAHPPDLVIKLLVSPEVAGRRKPEMQLDEIGRRQEAVCALQWSGVSRTTRVDADRSAGEVLLACKRRVWEVL